MAVVLKCDADELKVGDILSRVSYMKVVADRGTSIRVKNETGYEWDISKDIVSHECHTADHFTEEEAVTRSRLAEILTDEVRDDAFTVQFSKQATSKKAQEVMDQALKDGALLEGKGRKRKLKELADACLGGT